MNEHYVLGLDRELARGDLFSTSGVGWMCFTDQVLHAALAGHCALEQTIYVPTEAMVSPSTAPLRVLEAIAGRALM